MRDIVTNVRRLRKQVLQVKQFMKETSQEIPKQDVTKDYHVEE